jgi:hypothetical protein
VRGVEEGDQVRHLRFQDRLLESFGHERQPRADHFRDVGAEDCVLGSLAATERQARRSLGNDDARICRLQPVLTHRDCDGSIT